MIPAKYSTKDSSENIKWIYQYVNITSYLTCADIN